MEHTSEPGKPVRRDELVFDGFLAIGLYLLLAASLFVVPPDLATDLDLAWGAYLGWGAYLAGGFITLPLMFRRRAPQTVFLIVIVAMTTFRLIQAGEVLISSIAWFLAYYGLGRYGRARFRNPLRIGNVLAFIGLYVVAWANIRAMPEGAALFNFLAVNMIMDAGVLIAGWILGDRSRAIHARAAELDRLQREQELERERELHRAVLDERTRIAREFHDVVGHHVSVIGIQAAGARRVLGRDPAGAEHALRAIEQTSRQAVQEMQRALALLRGEDDGREPPGEGGRTDVELGYLTRIEDVMERTRGAGIAVISEIGPLPNLPASVQLAITRVVQESLTNALKHSGPGTSAWVVIDAIDELVHVRIGDDGRGEHPNRQHGSGGRGLVGLQERVSLHGGSFHAGPRPTGGYEVRATIPHRSATPAGRPGSST